MSDRTTLLFALSQDQVLDVTPDPGGGRRILIESVVEQDGCPACGVMSRLIKDRPTSRVKDLPHGPRPLIVFVRKRWFACTEVLDDPTHEISVAWAYKEPLRQLLTAHGPTRYSRHETAHRRTRFRLACTCSEGPSGPRPRDRIPKARMSTEAGQPQPVHPIGYMSDDLHPTGGQVVASFARKIQALKTI